MYYDSQALKAPYRGMWQLAPGNKFVFTSKQYYSFDVYLGKYSQEEYCDRQNYAYIKWRNLRYGDKCVLLSDDCTSHAILYCAERKFTFHTDWRHMYLLSPLKPHDCLFEWYAGPDNVNEIWNALNEIP